MRSLLKVRLRFGTIIGNFPRFNMYSRSWEAPSGLSVTSNPPKVTINYIPTYVVDRLFSPSQAVTGNVHDHIGYLGRDLHG